VIEVELKFRLPEGKTIASLVAEIGGRAGETVRQIDVYYQHPARDFHATDEAFRIRAVGERNSLTYKGPLLDRVSKTRKEIEIDFAEGDSARRSMEEMLTSLGFVPRPAVVKDRTEYEGRVDSLDLHLCHDRVEGLGEFVELETLADESRWTVARDALIALAARLGLGESERRSYLVMLLERSGFDEG